MHELRHIFDIIDTPTQLIRTAKIINSNQQRLKQSECNKIQEYLSLSGTLRVLEHILISHLLMKHLGVLGRRWRRIVLTLTKVILVYVRRGPIWRMVIVVGSCCHIWRWGKRWWGVELTLTWRRLLRRGIVILMVHMVILTWIRHFERMETGTAGGQVGCGSFMDRCLKSNGMEPGV